MIETQTDLYFSQRFSGSLFLWRYEIYVQGVEEEQLGFVFYGLFVFYRII